VIRAVGDPNWRFQEDYSHPRAAIQRPVRIPDHGPTREAAQANAQGLAQLSAERVRDEWFKGILTARRVSRLVTLWREIGAARIWLPEIGGPAEARRVQVVDALPRDPVLVTAFLATDPASLLTRLKCANRDIERGRAMREWRDRYPDPKRVAEVRRWLSETGPASDDLLAQLAAAAPRTALPRVVEAIRAARDPLTLKDLALRGEDLIAAGVRPGPAIGEMLQRLLTDVLEDPRRNTREHLLDRVRDWLKAA
jgi:tRNA nucleotidyltransferase (CCA-adding enzyme)